MDLVTQIEFTVKWLDFLHLSRELKQSSELTSA